MKMESVKGLGSQQCYYCKYSVEFRNHNQECIHYHRFPREHERCKLWIKNGKFSELEEMNSINLNGSYYLCNKHFSRDMYRYDGSNRLVWNAVPTIFNITTDKRKEQQLVEKIPYSTKELLPKLSSITDASKHDFCKKIISVPISAALNFSDTKSAETCAVQQSAKTSAVKQKKNVSCGLRNVGNTCFLNSVIQALFYVAAFRHSVMSLPILHPPYVYPHVGMAMQRTFSNMQVSGHGVIAPLDVIGVLEEISPKLKVGQQADALDFMLPLLNTLSLQSPNSKITDIFSFHDVNYRVCSCGEESYLGVQQNYNLIIPIIEGRTPKYNIDKNEWICVDSVQAALDQSFLPEAAEEKFCFACNTTQPHVIKRTIISFPHVLIVQLLRYVCVTGPPKKVFTVKNNVKMCDYISFSSTVEGQIVRYKFQSSIAHYGKSLNKGHYFCQVKDNDEVMTCNDEIVTIEHPLDEGNSYILIYEKCSGMDTESHTSIDDHPSPGDAKPNGTTSISPSISQNTPSIRDERSSHIEPKIENKFQKVKIGQPDGYKEEQNVPGQYQSQLNYVPISGEDYVPFRDFDKINLECLDVDSVKLPETMEELYTMIFEHDDDNDLQRIENNDNDNYFSSTYWSSKCDETHVETENLEDDKRMLCALDAKPRKERLKSRKKLHMCEEVKGPVIKKMKCSNTREKCVLTVAREKVTGVNVFEALHNLGVTQKSDLTPKKRKVYDTLLFLKSNLKYYITLAEKYRGNLTDIKKSKYGTVFEVLRNAIPDPMCELIIKNIQYSGENKNKSHGHRWTNDEVSAMLTLHKISPSAYDYLAMHLKLPSTSTFQRLLSKIKVKPGYNDFILDHAAAVTEFIDSSSRIIVIEFDETSTKKHLSVNVTEGQIDGFVDYGEEEGDRLPIISNNALIFLAQSISGEWKLPIQYSFANKTTPAEILQRMLLKLIREARARNLYVIATSCDQGGNNRKALRLLGASAENPSFLVDGIRVFSVFDVCHLLKAIRAALRANQFVYDGTILQWKDLSDTYEYDQGKTSKLLSHLDKKKHFNYTVIEAMKVVLATQVCSSRMSASLKRRALELKKKLEEIVKSISQLPAEHQVKASLSHNLAENLSLRNRLFVTSDVIKQIDDMFDSMNCSNKKNEKKILRRPATANSPHSDVWRRSVGFIEKCTMRDNQNRERPTRNNIIWTLRAMLLIQEHLRGMNVESFHSRALTTDGLENYNGIVKRIAKDDRPTCQTFTGAFTSTIISNKSVPLASTKNCETDDAVIRCNLNFLLNSASSDEVKEIHVPEKIEVVIPEATSEDIELSFFSCREVLDKLLTVKMCRSCKDSICSQNPVHSVERKILSELERNVTYSNNMSPNKTFAKNFFYCSHLINQILPERAHRRRIFKFIVKAVLSVYDFRDMGCSDHKDEFVKKFVTAVVVWCAEQYCKNVNRGMKAEEDEKRKEKKRFD